MRLHLIGIWILFFALPALDGCQGVAQEPPVRQAYALVIHGGAGTILRENMDAEKEASYRAALQKALDTGGAILANGGTAMDAVEKTIQVMEDNPLFNSGTGAVLTNVGTAELDASFMDGATRDAGAVAGVKTIRSPIAAARKVMENSPHVMLAREGAERFAQEQGLETVENDFFITPARKAQWEAIQSKESDGGSLFFPSDPLSRKFGTVGAVALDQEGHIAAGTSTGGMMNKRWGRIGDSPVIGAGTYADDATCGVSCTGHGEYFIRYAVAYDVAAQMRYGGSSLAAATQHTVHETLPAAGGTGGLIALDKDGNVSMSFNTPGMYRGFLQADGKSGVYIYKDEE